MKKLALIAALASVIAMPMAANAATAIGNFNVSVVFTPLCTAAITAPVPSIAFTYTAFAAASAPVTISASPVVLTCSRGLGAVATAAYGEGGAASGLIGITNLRYTLSAITKSTAAGAVATGITGGTVGGPDTVSFSFDATLPQQAGAATTNAVVNATDARTLIITF